MAFRRGLVRKYSIMFVEYGMSGWLGKFSIVKWIDFPLKMVNWACGFISSASKDWIKMTVKE